MADYDDDRAEYLAWAFGRQPKDFREAPTYDPKAVVMPPPLPPKHWIGPQTWMAPNPNVPEQAVRESSAKAGEAYRRGDYGDLAYNALQTLGGMSQGLAPAAAGIIVGPASAARWAKTKNPDTGLPWRHREEWGGKDRLPAAQADQEYWKNYRDPDVALAGWRKYGWAPENAYGPARHNPLMQPSTVAATPDLGIDQSKLRYGTASFRGSDYPVFGMTGKLGDLAVGLDKGFAGNPELRKLPTRVQVDPDEVQAKSSGDVGSVGLGPVYPGASTQRAWQIFRGPSGLFPERMKANELIATGKNWDQLMDVFGHETGHLFAHTQGVGLGNVGVPGVQIISPIHDTPAQRQFEAMMHHYAERGEPGDAGREARYKMIADAIPNLAGYFNSQHERVARENVVRGKGDLEYQKTLPPGHVNVFARENRPMGAVPHGITVPGMGIIPLEALERPALMRVLRQRIEDQDPNRPDPLLPLGYPMGMNRGSGRP
jgi:hypothetical protein